MKLLGRKRLADGSACVFPDEIGLPLDKARTAVLFGFTLRGVAGV
jgi:hypothetical protein